MSTLSVLVKTSTEFIVSETEWLRFDITVTAKRRAIKTATVVGTITNSLTGEFDEASVTTDKYGHSKLRFKATETGWFTIKLAATKSGYTDGSFTISILSLEKPTEYTTKNKLYLNLIEERKKNLLYELQRYLDNDPQFDRSTGASDRITYLTEWNFQNKNFPLIVASNEGPDFQFMGLNNVIDISTRGGIANVVFGLNIVAENKNILDRLTEKCIFVLSFKHLEFYGKYGIYINLPLSTSGLSTEPYGARMLYANKINIPTRIEIAYNIGAIDKIESIEPTGTLVPNI